MLQPMKTVHHLLLSDEYIAESQYVQIAQNRTLRFLYQSWWVWWLPRIVLVGTIAICLTVHLGWAAALIAVFFIFTFWGEHFGRRSLAKARSRTPGKGTTTTVSMDENGIDTVGALGTTHLKWEAVRLPVVKEDGVLLMVTNTGGLWLPDRTLAEGTPNGVRDLIALKAKIS
jgi:hypothetical protein